MRTIKISLIVCCSVLILGCDNLLEINLPENYSGWVYIREDSSLGKDEVIFLSPVAYVSSNLFIEGAKLEVLIAGEKLSEEDIKYFGVNYYTPMQYRSKKTIRTEDKMRVVQFYIPDSLELSFEKGYWISRENERSFLRRSMEEADSLIVEGILK